jgi:hypothetical protein
LASISAAVLLAACSYNTSGFTVGDGSTGVDTTIDDLGDDTTVDETDDSGTETNIDDTLDAKFDSKDADTFDTTPFDAAACLESGTIVCGPPSRCALTEDDPSHCTGAAGSCGITCADDQACTNGVCACRPGLTLCGAACVDLVGDSTHCGSCGATPCSAANPRCVSGTCGKTCPGGRSDCGGGCWDLSGDPTHCGTDCSHVTACKVDELCISGTCHSYLPAIGCKTVSACDCTSILGSGARACPALTGSTDGVPICVAGSTFCPAAPWN